MVRTSGICPPGFGTTAASLDVDCAHTAAVVSARAPWHLAHGSMAVIEAAMVLGAIAALVHAVLWWRRRGDTGNLGLWLATVVYVLVLEPPLYFPDRFGLDGQVGLIFVHNLFSVQFLQDRMPLYIVALYPAVTYPAYALVQRSGLLDRVGPVAGAACVAVTFQALYEVFDGLGPALHWWAWNPDSPVTSPMFGDVPLSSLAIFAGASPFGLALFGRWLLAGRARLRVWRVVAVAVLTPLVMGLLALPYGVVSRLPRASGVAQSLSLWAVVAALAAVAVVTWVRDRRAPQAVTATGPRHAVDLTDRLLDTYPAAATLATLVVLLAIWPRAAGDAAVENLVYALVCTVVVVGAVASALARSEPLDDGRRREGAAGAHADQGGLAAGPL